MLSLIGIREKLFEKKVIAISPIVGGKSLKGPAAQMFLDQGIEPSAAAVAKYYHNILNAIVIDGQDRDQHLSIDQTGIICLTTNIIMNNTGDRIRLAEEIMHFCENLIP